jgi:hypothetical protein
MRLAELVGSSGSSANDREEIGFAKDSPLEGNGFELSVPRYLATADSVTPSFGDERRLPRGRRYSSIGLLRPTSARMIHRAVCRSAPTRAKPRKRWLSRAELKVRIQSPPPTSLLRTSICIGATALRPGYCTEPGLGRGGSWCLGLAKTHV